MNTDVNLDGYILKVIGLLSDFPESSYKSFDDMFIANGFKKDLYPTTQDGKHDRNSENFLKDYFYPSFRNLMFLEHKSFSNARYINSDIKKVNIQTHFINDLNERANKMIGIQIANTEVYIFSGYIGLFSLDIRLSQEKINLKNLEEILFAIRNFNTLSSDNMQWHEWISRNLLCGSKLRGEGIKADEYSGSKFKLYTVIDIDSNYNTEELLYDIATVSKIGSAAGETSSSPDMKYYKHLIENKISIFKNWQALCLFDSFTCIGSGQLSGGRISWDYTYFRIYIYRLFIKYNLYRYNSTIYEEKNLLQLRNEFQGFLNNYNLSHISFNFLGNELYRKIGEALELDVELSSFEYRINQISNSIREEKQSKTNRLLALVTVLSAIGSIVPLILTFNDSRKKWGMSDTTYDISTSIFLLLFFLGVLLFYDKNIFRSKWLRKK